MLLKFVWIHNIEIYKKINEIDPENYKDVYVGYKTELFIHVVVEAIFTLS